MQSKIANEFIKSVRIWISKINQAEREILRKNKFDLTVRELRYISIINENNGKTIKEILPFTGVTKSTFSNQLKYLIKKGFVSLKISKKDRRVKNVSLTQKGKRVELLISEIKNVYLTKAEKLASAKEMEKIIDIISKIAQAI